MKSFSIFRTVILSLSLILITILLFNVRNDTTNLNRPNALAEAEDQDSLDVFKAKVRLALQIANELDFLVNEFEKTDELEGAIDAIQIAIEEGETLLSDVQQFDLGSSSDLFNIKWKVENVLVDYIAGLTMQLNGFENGDGQLASDGYILVSTSKTELQEILGELE